MSATLLLSALSGRAEAATLTWTGGAGDGQWTSALNWTPAQVPTSADDVTIDVTRTVNVGGSIAFNSLTLGDAAGSNAPVLAISAAVSTGGSLTIEPGAALRQNTAAPLGFGSIVVLPGGSITHGANAGSRSFVINLNVAQGFDLQAGATVSASGLGYAGAGQNTNQGGFGPGGGKAVNNQAEGGGGGGHGGVGGNGRNFAGSGGAAYDSPTSPTDLGSGGGAGVNSGCSGGGAGGAGGGAVLIAAASLTVDGAVIANGNPGQNFGCGNDGGGGGGAGGTISLTAGTLAGTGQLQANGGAGATQNYQGGGGAGGRVAILVTGTDGSNLNIQANSGVSGGNGAGNGGAGTITINTQGGANYNLTIGDLTHVPNSGTPVSGANPAFSTVTLNDAIVSFDPGSTVNINSLIVAGNVSLTANALVFPADGSIEISNGARLQLAANSTSGGNLHVDGGGVFMQMNTAQLAFNSAVVQPGGLMTHAANAVARAALLNLKIANDFDIQAGASVSASGLGYAGGGQSTNQGGFGPGGGKAVNNQAEGGAGGGHGGVGGNGRNFAGGGGAAYDSPTSPADLGSGGGAGVNSGCSGGGAGGAGGGAVLITAASLRVDGAVIANGNPGQNFGCGNDGGGGGGAGGTINLTVGRLAGTGQLVANGGAGASQNYQGGGGAGGRVAILVTGADESNLNVQANSGLGGNSLAGVGGAGTIAVNTQGGANYNLTIGDFSHSPNSATPISGSNPTFSTVTLNDSIVSFDPGSTVNINSLVVAGNVSLTANSLVFPANGTLEIKSGARLQLAASSTSGGSLQVDGGGVFVQMNTAQLAFGSIDLLPGGLLTHAANSSSRSAVLNLKTTGDFDVQAGASIVVSGLGYAGAGQSTNQGGFGPGGGKAVNNQAEGGGGGGHGGAGGNGRNFAGSGGAAYDSPTSPTDLGSGGGAGVNSGCSGGGAGGAGGGAVLIAAASLTVDGAVIANGNPGQNLGCGNDGGGGGGAGGTINLDAATLSGTGQLQANGGAGATQNYQGGGGAGGRVAILVTGTDSSSLDVQANSGVAGNSLAGVGGAGTVALNTQGGATYNLTIGDLAHLPASATPIAGSNPTFSTVTLNDSIVSFDPGSTVNINSLIVAGNVSMTANSLAFPPGASLEIKSGARLQLAASSTSGGTLQVDGGGTFEQMNAVPLTFDSIQVLPGGLLTHAPNTTSRASVLNLKAQDFDLQAGASIAASGLGYVGAGQSTNQAGFGPGGGKPVNNSPEGGAGGGHGGVGGNGRNFASSGGAAYDSPTSPIDLGSGGGAGVNGGCSGGGAGGTGGGAVLLAADRMTIDGQVFVNGNPGQNLGCGNDGSGGGGAGGTISLTAGTLAGAGQLQANGGAGGSQSYQGGGGAGGRVAILVTGTDGSNLNVQADAGPSGGSSAGVGGAGTVAINTQGGSNYNLTIGDFAHLPNSATPIAGANPTFSTVTLNDSIVSFDPGSTVDINSLIVAGNVAINANKLVFPTDGPVEIKSGALLQMTANATAGGDLQVDGGGVFEQTNTNQLSFNSIVVQPGGLMTHALNTTARAAVLNLSVAAGFTLQAGATVTVDGLGYAGAGQNTNQGGFGPGGGKPVNNSPEGGGGAGHGGVGGSGRNFANSGGAAYDDAAFPTDLGSGGGAGVNGGCQGGGAGGHGGGVVLIYSSGALTINGLVTAEGAAGQSLGCSNDGSGGGGAGGTINLTGATLTGVGALRTDGGAGGSQAYAGGGGAGGRIFTSGCQSVPVSASAVGGAAGGSGASAGAAGSNANSVPSSCPAAPQPPQSLAAVFVPAQKAVTLSWTAATGAASYTLYRSNSPIGSIAAAPILQTNLTATAFSDIPDRDATYYYMVTSVNSLGLQSEPSNQASAGFDVHPPTIRVSGVASGQYTNINVAPTVTFSDFSSFTSTISLNGQAFLSGTTVAAEGAYTLLASATDFYGNASSATVSFTIDKTSPTLAITFPPSGLVTNQDVHVAFTASDNLTPAGALAIRSSQGAAPPYSFTQSGAYALSLTAADLAGNQAVSSVTFTLDKLAPAAIGDLRVTAVHASAGTMDLAWSAPGDNLTGVARYVIVSATTPITGADFASLPAVDNALVPQPTGSTETFTVPLVAEHVNYAAIESVDGAGNVSSISNAPFVNLQPPQITFLNLSPSVIVGRPLRVDAAVADVQTVSEVTFSVDGVEQAVSTAAPFSFFWNTVPLADQGHTVSASAQDISGNVGEASVTVFTSYAPPLIPTLSSPANGSVFAQDTVTVSGTAELLTTAELFVNDLQVASTPTVDGRFTFSGFPLSSGDNLLSVAASDAKGQSAPSPAVRVVLDDQLPGAVASLTAQSRAAGAVELSWPRPSGIDLRFDVYRATAAVAADPAQRVAAGLSGLVYVDTPPVDGVYFYAVSAVDPLGQEGPLSPEAEATSDRAAPTAAVLLSSAPPLGPGTYQVTLNVSTPLAAAPVLTFSPRGGTAQPLALGEQTPTSFTGQLGVSAATPSGTALFGFQGTDLVGNTGYAILAGSVAVVDTTGPTAAIFLSSTPVKAGSYTVSLVSSKPLPQAPLLAYTPAGASDPVPVPLAGAATTWLGTVVISTATGDGTASFVFQGLDALGNPGATITQGQTFVVQTVPPGAPLFLHAFSKPAGAILVSWTQPLGSQVSSYNVFRSSQLVTSDVGLAPLLTGVTTLLVLDQPAADGLYFYAAQAVDAAGNIGELSNSTSAFSSRVAPDAPINFTGTTEGTGVSLSWSAAPMGQPAASYNLYRATYALVSVAGLTPIQADITANSASDFPLKNAVFTYAVTALSFAGNEGPAATVQVGFDANAPTIEVGGVADQGFYQGPVAPEIFIDDPELASSSSTLNDAPFASGTLVTEPSTYTLTVTATNLSSHTATTIVHFTIDETSPTISITGVTDGQTYQTAVTPQISASDANLAKLTATLNGAPFTPGTAVTQNGAYTLAAKATDKAGNSSAQSVTFTVFAAPQQPGALTVVLAAGQPAALSWSPPVGYVVSGYNVYRDGNKVNYTLLPAASFTDNGYAGGPAIYQVAAVDSSGREGVRAQATIFPLSVSLAKSVTLTRGYGDRLDFNVFNGDANPQTAGPIALKVAGQTMETAPQVYVPAGSTVAATGAVFTSASTLSPLAIEADISLPTDPGSSVTQIQALSLPVQNASLPAVQLFPANVSQGGTAQVRVQLANQGSSDLQVLTSQNHQPSADVQVAALDPAGNVVASANLNEQDASTLNSANPTYSLADIPPGGSFLFAPVALTIPAYVSTVTFRATISSSFYAYNTPAVAAGGGFQGALTIPAVSLPYGGTAAADKAVYDQGATVQVSGRALDGSGNPVPNVPLNIVVTGSGFDRPSTVQTDASGNYALSFTLNPAESGLYTISATHPSFAGRQVSATFNVIGLQASPNPIALTIPQGTSQNVPITLGDVGQTTLSGLAANVTVSSNLGGKVQAALTPAVAGATLGAGQSLSQTLTITAAADAVGSAAFSITYTNDQGATRTIPISVNVLPATPVPAWSPFPLQVAMQPAQSTVQNVTLSNNGLGPITNARLVGPGIPWIHLASILPSSIAPGGSAAVSLQFSPPSGTSGVFIDTLTVQGDGGVSLSLPIQVTVTQIFLGAAAVSVTDAVNGAPLSNAQVTLINQDVAGISYTATTDANGVAVFPSIHTSNYLVNMTAAGHSPVSQALKFYPNITNQFQSALQRTAVALSWNVEPTQITDQFDITLNMTFVSDPQMPILKPDPPTLSVDVPAGASVQVQYTLTNTGGVDALATALQADFDPNTGVNVRFGQTPIPSIKVGETSTVTLNITGSNACTTANGVIYNVAHFGPSGQLQNVSQVLLQVNTLGANGASCQAPIPPRPTFVSGVSGYLIRYAGAALQVFQGFQNKLPGSPPQSSVCGTVTIQAPSAALPGVPVQLSAAGSPAGGTFKWTSTGGTFDNPSSPTPNFTPTTAGAAVVVNVEYDLTVQGQQTAALSATTIQVANNAPQVLFTDMNGNVKDQFDVNADTVVVWYVVPSQADLGSLSITGVSFDQTFTATWLPPDTVLNDPIDLTKYMDATAVGTTAPNGRVTAAKLEFNPNAAFDAAGGIDDVVGDASAVFNPTHGTFNASVQITNAGLSIRQTQIEKSTGPVIFSPAPVSSQTNQTHPEKELDTNVIVDLMSNCDTVPQPGYNRPFKKYTDPWYADQPPGTLYTTSVAIAEASSGKIPIDLLTNGVCTPTFITNPTDIIARLTALANPVQSAGPLPFLTPTVVAFLNFANEAYNDAIADYNALNPGQKAKSIRLDDATHLPVPFADQTIMASAALNGRILVTHDAPIVRLSRTLLGRFLLNVEPGGEDVNNPRFDVLYGASETIGSE